MYISPYIYIIFDVKFWCGSPKPFSNAEEKQEKDKIYMYKGWFLIRYQMIFDKVNYNYYKYKFQFLNI